MTMAEQRYAKSLAELDAEPVPKQVVPRPGNRVLIGRRGITVPEDWYIATVLWACSDECLVERGGRCGAGPTRDLVNMQDVRAVAESISDLLDFQHEARRLVADRRKLVEARENAAAVARSLLWKKLDEIGLGVPVYRGEKRDG